MIDLKSEAEVNRMRAACTAAARVLQDLSSLVVPGVSTAGLDAAARGLMTRHGCESACHGYVVGRLTYPGYVCISVNDEIVHGIGAPDRIIRDGDLGVIAGARIYQFANLAANSENLAGWVAGPDAIAFASALPETEIPGWEVANAVDADTGLAVQILMGQEQSGYYNVTATLLFGAAVGRATSLVRLKTA